MRSRQIVSLFWIAALCLGACTGCGGDPDRPAELAKLSPPPPRATEKARTKPLPARPKFGSPPKSQMIPPADRGQ
jgi:hypothetical protein